jgi:hypothetical protein
MAGSTPSADTSEFSACTRWNAGLSTLARSEEWTSLPGPRPHFSPLATTSHSITPLAPSEISSVPSRFCPADGMKMPLQRESAFITSGACTTCAK